MRVFYDAGVDRWFVLQRAQDNDINGNTLGSSHMYLAVSQTPNPTGTYNIYEANTTNAQQSGCPCLADYPQIGADQYGFYISAGLYNTFSQSFVVATILAISKASLAAGVTIPTVSKFTIPLSTGYEFSIQPASTPPGASYFLGNAGVEYFASTPGTSSSGSSVAIWAMTNTSSLATANPVPIITRIIVPTMPYVYPDVATQRPGSRPYGESLSQPISYIDGGDIRALSLSYAGAKLHLTLSTKVTDEMGRTLVGGAYMVFAPAVRGTVLTSPVYRQSYQMVSNNHLLRPSIAVDAQGPRRHCGDLSRPRLVSHGRVHSSRHNRIIAERRFELRKPVNCRRTDSRDIQVVSGLVLLVGVTTPRQSWLRMGRYGWWRNTSGTYPELTLPIGIRLLCRSSRK